MFRYISIYKNFSSWETQTGLHVALYSRQNDTEIDKQLTVDWAVRYWIDKGCSASKLVMGLALYGRTFRLASSINNQIGAAAVGPGLNLMLDFHLFRTKNNSF